MYFIEFKRLFRLPFFCFFASVALTNVAPMVLAAPQGGVPFNALVAPSAGALTQQIERERELNPLHLSAPAPVQNLQENANSSGASFTLKEFRFVGNHLYSNEQLAQVLSPYLNRSVQIKDLQDASASVANFYRLSGWVVKAVLPSQDIANGVVTIQVIEAKFGRVRLEGDTSKRVKLEIIVATLMASQKPGAPVNTNAIDQGLALVGELAGVKVQGNLAAGQIEGETDLIVSVIDQPFITGDAGADNSGSRSTGSDRITANLSLNSWMGLGDLLGLNALTTSGSGYVRVSQTVPLGYSGLKLGVNASNLNYHLVTQDFAALNANGYASSLGLEMSYPFQKTPSSLLSGVLSVDKKHYLNNAQGAVASDYANTPVTLSLNGLGSDDWGGGSSTLASLNLSRGSINLSNSPAQFQVNDANTTQIAGPYNKLRYMLTREQSLGRGLSAYLSLSGQTANKNLDSSEKFYLGGINGVRAYPSNEAGGTKAQMMTAELRSRFKERFSLSAFYDYGRIVLNSSNQFTGASALNQYALKGSGVSLGYQAPSGVSLKATFSSRIGVNPNPTSTGNDQDGSFVKNRVWLNVNVPF